ncbi:hypothetical protein [Paenibacillus sp. UNC496MF]|uniref:hypothetical protein n=1 Tax=Paenibacillus sp. UNC496MF TaxID=1502753 RepID=UPI0011602652|nr:hypothetical protein [Paenibacillus sp. UNC496MF]
MTNNVGLHDPIFRDRAIKALQSSPLAYAEVKAEIGDDIADNWKRDMAPFDKPMDDGLCFRLKLDRNQFIVTYCDAEVAYRSGFTTRQALGKPVASIFQDKEVVDALSELHIKAWCGMDVIFFGSGNKPNSDYRVHLKRVGEELVGYLEFIDRYKLDDDIVKAKTVDLQSLKKKKPPISELLRPHMYRSLTEDQVAIILDQLREM